MNNNTNSVDNAIEIEDHIQSLISQTIFLTVATAESILSHENGADALALYIFYYKNAKRQKTNQPKSVDSFCMKGLHFGKKRFHNAKKTLISLGLIEGVITKGENGKITGHYMRISYKWGKDKESLVLKHMNIDKPVAEPTKPQVSKAPSGIQETNAYSIKDKMLTEYKDNSFSSSGEEQNGAKKQTLDSDEESKRDRHRQISSNGKYHFLYTKSMYKYGEAVQDCFEAYFDLYQKYKGKEHPPIKQEQIKKVANVFEEYMDEYHIGYMIEYFFKEYKYPATDHNINHFADPAVFNIIGMRAGL